MKTYENFITNLFNKDSWKKIPVTKVYVSKYIVFYHYSPADSLYSDNLLNWSISELPNHYLILAKVLQKNPNPEQYLINVLDYVAETTDNFIAYTFRKLEPMSFYLNDIRILYDSGDLTNAQQKFEEIKETEPYATWILNQTANKYNI